MEISDGGVLGLSDGRAILEQAIVSDTCTTFLSNSRLSFRVQIPSCFNLRKFPIGSCDYDTCLVIMELIQRRDFLTIIPLIVVSGDYNLLCAASWKFYILWSKEFISFL